ncbi:MAG: 3-phosphoglycerate dehydrogenase [Bacteroidetes bacterium GWF2_38_335]|nr:MAG: 3-phosphoglycerate dehydrogenase [Bacteroidetes bacterium GWF2_38_335]OFY78207.1 MAG: 3-phosphoglycerate dehydrogenase [Bacteroidetes bacterium RIFOXYA12_FULL_38_20]HBS88630.1 3-phosphoglycerate dehydrogenase [Bacteroidales bacterium]
MKKVLIATDKPFAKEAVEGIKKIAQEAKYELVLLEKYTEVKQLLDAVKDVDAMIVRSDLITREVVEHAKNLKIVVRAGAGYDNLDLAACTEHGVCAMNTPGQNSNAVAELALGMMVYMARGCFGGKSGTELKEKTLGIHAYGNVGKLVADIAKGFGMKIYAYDPFIPEDKIKKDNVTPVSSVEELYSKCQYVSLHIPANDKTKKSINYDLLKKMPKNAMLVNTARKEVIDEEGMVKLMEERPDFRYVSDIEPGNKAVFEEKFKGRYYFTPNKMGAQTEEANINAGFAAMRQIVAFLENGDATYKVNK